MKKYLLLLIYLLSIANCFSQGVWTQKADFGGGATSDAIGFSIGNKGYIEILSDTLTNFWEWDQTTNIWAQNANFPGGLRTAAVAFSIGNKGYIGTGDSSGISRNDFWEFNPATNSWTQKADFAGIGRGAAIGFSIGTKGYIGTGQNGSNNLSDFWEWESDTNSGAYNTWIQKANYGGGPISGAVSFSIGTKGYIGMAGPPIFWEWDQNTNIWTQKANFSGPGGNLKVGFSLGTNGYVGTGVYMAVYQNAFLEWNQSTDSWSPKANFVTARCLACGFSIGSKGYIGTGISGTPFNPIVCNDFWEFDPNGNGISEAELENSISVYPSPTKGRVNLKINLPIAIGVENLKMNSLEIFNVRGEKIYLAANSQITSSSNSQIDLSSQPNGIYFLQIKTEQGNVTKKIVLSH